MSSRIATEPARTVTARVTSPARGSMAWETTTTEAPAAARSPIHRRTSSAICRSRASRGSSSRMWSGLADERRGEEGPLALARGQLPDRPPGFVREPEDLQGFRARGLRLAAEAADEAEDVPEGGVGRDVGELREIGQAAARFGLPHPEVEAVDEDPAPVRPLDAGRELEQGALAAAVRAEKERQAGPEREGRVPDDGPVGLVGERDVFEDHHDALQDRGSPAFEWRRSAQRVGLRRRSAFRARRKAPGAAAAKRNEVQGRRARTRDRIAPSIAICPSAPNGRSPASRMAPAPRMASQASGPRR